MRKIRLFIAMSLDGYIADAKGGIGWLGGQTADGDDMVSYEKFIEDVDTVLMGANTYRQLMTELAAEEWVYGGMTTYVVTHHPEAFADVSPEEIRFTGENPCELVKRLREEPGRDIWLCGGASVVQQLLKADLIDQYYMNVIPTILGGGIRLFGELEQERKLKLVETRSYNGITDLVYERRRVNRCWWVNRKNPRYIAYHDTEWGVPLHDDGKLFEMLLLECFQAGLSWECVLNKRAAFRAAFDRFDVEQVSRYGEDKIEELMQNPDIIRNRRKIQACITNSHVFLAIQEEFGSFDAYIWGFTGGKVIHESCDLRTTSPLSDAISEDLKKRGMKFVGSTVIYAYLQSVGILHAHVKDCDWYREEI